jgi:hypothetical protein
MEDSSWKQKIDVLSEILSKYTKEIAGKFSVFQDKKLRIR